MKTPLIGKTLAVTFVAGLALLARDASAQNIPPLDPGVTQVIQLEQAKLGDDVIIAYINNSATGYSLDANKLIYLRQQGVSDAVLAAMLGRSKAGNFAATAAMPPTPPPQPFVAPVQAVVPIDPPPVTYVQTVPVVDYAPTYYAGPPVAVAVGFGWGWRWGGGWWHGGWHGRGWR